MRIRTPLLVALGSALLVGCQADREVFEEGATLAPPEEVQEAPAYPIPPQPIGTPGAADTVIGDTTARRDTLEMGDTARSL